MLKAIIHGFNLLRHSMRDIGLSAKRSGKWPTVEKHFLEAHPTCAACGGKERLNVHHCIPFSTDPKLELDEANLITLCMGKSECHLLIGHGNNFRFFNKNVKEDVIYLKAHPNEFNLIIKYIEKNRIPNK